ncbi:MAG: hypothetical protein V3V08_19200 [Nannocystaceae bacterium]
MRNRLAILSLVGSASLVLTFTGCADDGADSSGQSTPTPAPPGEMIDDMEDKDGAILEVSGRSGAWYTSNDESKDGTQTPASDADFTMTELEAPREKSKYAARCQGSGFKEWGAAFGFNLNEPDGKDRGTYDASKYAGLVFWARNGEAGPQSFTLAFVDDQTDPQGGNCDESKADDCWDHFATSVKLTDKWEQYEIEIADLKQGGWGKKFDALHLNALYSVEFQNEAAVDFDIWIDDIAFTEE